MLWTSHNKLYSRGQSHVVVLWYAYILLYSKLSVCRLLDLPFLAEVNLIFG